MDWSSLWGNEWCYLHHARPILFVGVKIFPGSVMIGQTWQHLTCSQHCWSITLRQCPSIDSIRIEVYAGKSTTRLGVTIASLLHHLITWCWRKAVAVLLLNCPVTTFYLLKYFWMAVFQVDHLGEICWNISRIVYPIKREKLRQHLNTGRNVGFPIRFFSLSSPWSSTWIIHHILLFLSHLYDEK